MKIKLSKREIEIWKDRILERFYQEASDSIQELSKKEIEDAIIEGKIDFSLTIDFKTSMGGDLGKSILEAREEKKRFLENYNE